MPNTNGEGTEGLSIRELLLEVRQDIKEFQKVIPTFVTRKELWAINVGIGTVLLGVILSVNA